MHDLTIIHMLAFALAAALFFGWATQRLGLSPLVGYLLAGVLVGPYTPGFVADRALASQLSEMGVVLLLFGVGLHFHPAELLRVWRIAVPGAVAQSCVATLLGWLLARALGWSSSAGLVVGMALSVASTVVLMRMLMERKRLDTKEGQVAVGWLIVEDIFTVIALVVLPALAAPDEGTSLAWELTLALGKVGAFAAIVWIGGRWLVGPLLERMARTRSSELFTLGVFVVALGVALLAAEGFHVSVALGAFFAGLVVGQSRIGVQAAVDVAPFRDVFSALFFVSVGMLFDPAILLKEPLMILGVLAIVLVAKPAIAWLVVRLMRRSQSVAMTVAVGLAQIGEFSFILAGLGLSLKILSQPGFNAIVAAALISIAINPLLFSILPRLERQRQKETQPEPPRINQPAGTAQGLIIVVAGFGPIGRKLCARLKRANRGFMVVDDDMSRIEAAADEGYATCYGDPGRDDVLAAAGIKRAHLLVLAELELAQRIRACVAAKAVSPHARIVATVRNAGERVWLEEFGVGAVVAEDTTVARALYEQVEAIHQA
ncbi:cation:proton antiporter [Niveibacterium sp. SC-1]|uniref:cation:proton antiporter n=1 Tax=Niveibacterium sp. SC-1 TaxID=3135646 RepID=UPI00311DB1C0